MKTEIILTNNIVGLGAESDQVKVAAGYARNYLFPHRLAIPLTRANKRQIEALKQRRAEREAHEFNTMSELAKAVSKLICLVKVKAGEDGKMFGSVTAGMIADELKHQFDISLDKRKIHLEHPIRALGEHEIELHLHAEVKGTLKVRVESLTPAAAPAPEAAASAEAKTEEGRRPRTEKRGFGRRDAKSEKVEKPPRNQKRLKLPEKRNRARPKVKSRQKPPKHPRPKKPRKRKSRRKQSNRNIIYSSSRSRGNVSAAFLLSRPIKSFDLGAWLCFAPAIWDESARTSRFRPSIISPGISPAARSELVRSRPHVCVVLHVPL